MSEMTETQQEELDFEPRPRTVSFPDHYLLPYIERCKNSRRITCGCSIIFIGLAIFCFFATNYMINYPVTGARKIAFVFAGIFCLVAAVSCLQLRFKIFNECRDTPDDNTLFEIARREDVVFSDSFELQELPFCHGTPKEGHSKSDTSNELSSLAHSADQSSNDNISPLRYNPRGQLPRHSISGHQSQDVPLLPPRTPVEISSSSRLRNEIDSKILQIGRIVRDCNNYPPNYSTFENNNASKESKPLVNDSTFKNDCASETELLTSEDDYDTSETKPLLSTESTCDETATKLSTSELTYMNGCDASETEAMLGKSTFKNDCASETELLMSENDYDTSETKQLLYTESTCDETATKLSTSELTYINGCDASENEAILGKSTFKNDCASETKLLMSENDYDTSETESTCEINETELPTSELTYMNGGDTSETEPILSKSTSENGCSVSEN